MKVTGDLFPFLGRRTDTRYFYLPPPPLHLDRSSLSLVQPIFLSHAPVSPQNSPSFLSEHRILFTLESVR